MSKRSLVFFALVVTTLIVAAGIPIISEDSDQEIGLISGQNVNMVSNIDPITGDPYLQRQNEPSIAASSRNPLHLLAGANDYRTIGMQFEEEMPGFVFEEEPVIGPTVEPSDTWDAWLGVFKSIDGGQTWTSTLLPGFHHHDTTPELAPPSPLASHVPPYEAAADPVVRAGTNGLFFYNGIAFIRSPITESNNNNKPPSAVFVARFIDNNNQEDTETIEYIDTIIIDESENYDDPYVFLDKPWIATDLPHGVGQKVTIKEQQIPKSNVYVVYSVFLGTGDNMVSKIMFRRSTDCGETWEPPFQEPPVELSTGHYLNQGATIAVDPRGNGQLCVSWRRFNKLDQKNAIVVAISTNGGVDFDRDIVVSEFPVYPPLPSASFDQPTWDYPLIFRTNTYPTSTMDGEGNIYIAWTQRGLGPNGEAQIMISTSHDGLSWSVPKEAITSDDDWTGPPYFEAPGNQFMPSITFAAGKLIMIWYDQRLDFSVWQPEPDYLLIFSDLYIWEDYLIRHTIDVRAAQAEPSLDPAFSKSVQVSRYLWGFIYDEEDPAFTQLQFNMPNLPLFQLGTVPFIGDYIDITPSPSIVPEGNHWRFNIDPNPSTVYHATWTDNRDVIPPGTDQDWWNYVAPEDCVNNPTEYAGIRNQNIYTSRITEGITSGSPGNTKPLSIKRAFVILVKNTTELYKTVTLEKDPDSLPTANFWQAGEQAGEEVSSLTVTIPPSSSLSATVLVEPYPDEYASVIINVLDENGIIVSQVTLNPDSTNPEILDAEAWDQSEPELSILYSEIHNPHGRNYDPDNLAIANPHGRNYSYENQLLMNPDIVTPHGRNYAIDNVTFVNPHGRNASLIPEDTEVTDIIYTIENSGNTTSSYSLSTFPVTIPEEVKFEIFVYKIYLTPTTKNCNLEEVEHHELVLIVPNPHGRNTPEEDRVIDGSFHLAPGEQANIIYRVSEDPNFDPTSLIPEITQDVPNVIDGVLQTSVGSMVFITTTAALPDGVIGNYYETSLEANGGTGNYTWSYAEGSDVLPDYLTLNSNGMISGTPDEQNGTDYPAIYSFTAQVSDQSNPPQTATQILSIRIVEELNIIPITLDEGIVGVLYPTTTLQATGGIGPYTWTITSGGLPPGLGLTQAGDVAEISGTPTSAGSSTFTIEVRDSTNPQQFATLPQLTIFIYEKLRITTTSLNPSDGYLGSLYTATIEAIGGLTPYSWAITSGQLPPGLDPPEGINNTQAVISGTPIYDSDASYPQEYSFDVTVTALSPIVQVDTLNCIITIHPKTHLNAIQDEGLGDNQATAIAVDDDGYVYVTGYSRGKTTGPDIYTVKYDSNLNEDIWTRRYDGPSHRGDYATDIAVKKDNNGNTYVYVTGYIHRGKQKKHADYCTLKYDSAGNLIWDKTYDSRRNGEDMANAIAVDDGGNVYVTGKSQESLEKNSVKSFDYLTIKYSPRGRLLWKKRYEGDESPEIITNNEAMAIIVKADHVYVTGYSSNGNNNDFATIKYNATNGNEVWTTLPNYAATYDGGYDDGANALAVDDNGNVYVSGYSFKDEENSDFATIKYGPDGNGGGGWIRTYEGGFNDAATDMVLKAGHVYVTGYSFNADGNSDFATIKYDSNGNAVWASEWPDGVAIFDGGLGDDEAVAIFVDDSEDIYVTGTSQGGLNKDYFTLKYNTTGNLIWLARYNSTNSTADWNDFATALVVDSSGHVYVTGYSQKPGDEKTNYILTVKY